MFLGFDMKNILHPALVRALVSSIDQSLIITAPGQRKTVYETLNKIAKLLLSGSLEKDKTTKGTIESPSSVLACSDKVTTTSAVTAKEFRLRMLPFEVACQRRGTQLWFIDSILSLDDKEDKIISTLLLELLYHVLYIHGATAAFLKIH
jgi:hypothetical protein